MLEGIVVMAITLLAIYCIIEIPAKIIEVIKSFLN